MLSVEKTWLNSFMYVSFHISAAATPPEAATPPAAAAAPPPAGGPAASAAPEAGLGQQRAGSRHQALRQVPQRHEVRPQGEADVDVDR